MKLSIYLSALLLLTLLFVSASCNKDKTPDEDKDWNVLEWKVDGERYKAECEGDPLFGCDPVDCQYYNNIGAIEIVGGTLEPTKGFYISIHEGMKLVGEDFKLKESDQVKYANKELVQECRRYMPDTSKIYNFRITYLDTIIKLIEGEFKFTFINNCQDTVYVDDGYFKLTYRP